jgi:hypothetical protein
MSAYYLKKFYEEALPEMVPLLRVERNGRESVCFWQRRYYDFNVRSADKLREKLTYLHHNPVRKGLADSPEDYSWSSAGWYVLQRSVGVRIEPGF